MRGNASSGSTASGRRIGSCPSALRARVTACVGIPKRTARSLSVAVERLAVSLGFRAS